MSTVPNAPAGRYVPAINPTKNGATFSGDPNGPAGRAPSAVNPTRENGTQVTGVANTVLTQLPATASAKVNWVPNSGPQPTPRATTPEITAQAGILDAAGAPVAGSGGPPYVQGNVTVGQNLVGTNVVLVPQP